MRDLLRLLALLVAGSRPSIDPLMGLMPGIKAFVAAVFGGIGNVPGAMVGGVIIGVVEALAGFWLPEGFKDIAAYVVVLLMLVFKPNGLFGDNLRKKV